MEQSQIINLLVPLRFLKLQSHFEKQGLKQKLSKAETQNHKFQIHSTINTLILRKAA